MAGMDQEHVVRELRKNEQVVAAQWRGPAGSRHPLPELHKLRDELQQKEGNHYELTLTSLERQSQVVALMLCERYGLHAFRRKGQRKTTLIVRGPKRFVEEAFWPVFESHMRVLIRAGDAWLHELLTHYQKASEEE